MVVTYKHQQDDDDLSSSLATPSKISISSSQLLDEEDFISINPNKPSTYHNNSNDEFEFFSSVKNMGGQNDTMSTADELFYDGKLLPFWQKHPCGVAGRIKTREVEGEAEEAEEEEEIVAVKTEEDKRVSGCNTSPPSWYLDEDPSPRPPKCTVLWKELLRLKKQRGSRSWSWSSSLSQSSSSSSSTSLSSSSMTDVAATEDNRKEPGSGNPREMYLQRFRKGLDKTRSGSMRIRPTVNLPVCTQMRTNANGGGLPPLFPIKKGRSVK